MRRSASVCTSAIHPVPTIPTRMRRQLIEAAVWPLRRTYSQARASTIARTASAERLAGVEAQQQPVEQGEDERTEDRAAVATHPAEDRRAADHRGGHRRQQVVVRLVDPDRTGGAGEQQSADRREHAGEHVHGQQHLPHPDAGEAAGDRVVADGVDRAPEPRRPQPPDEQGGDRGPHEEVLRERADERLRADLAHDAQHVRRARQPAAQTDGDDAEQHAGHPERHDQRVHLEHADGDAVDGADRRPPPPTPSAGRPARRARSGWRRRRPRGWRSWRSTGRSRR